MKYAESHRPSTSEQTELGRAHPLAVHVVLARLGNVTVDG